MPRQSDDVRRNLQAALSDRSKETFGAAVQITSLQIFSTQRDVLTGKHADLPLRRLEATIVAEEATAEQVAQAEPIGVDAAIKQWARLEEERAAILADPRRIRELEYIDSQIEALHGRIAAHRQLPSPPSAASPGAQSQGGDQTRAGACPARVRTGEAAIARADLCGR